MKRALLVIDVQDESCTGLLPVTHPHGHLDNILRVMDAATGSGVPVVVVQRHLEGLRRSAIGIVTGWRRPAGAPGAKRVEPAPKGSPNPGNLLYVR